ncbi:alpha/beta fold hydrolase [Candidatus Viadribacter manganicus]|uniref:Alpha/beta hydrolase n=1 Tax=Candidatus Viadribacter manganicus TaxID=1759059 RepID=A0A1B1AL46_9PROT|nr:alpha/beta hydrolase [Candidatus Viadribacter manganicus]ANP47296.1 alpha/beta hydrolase [Candidatus Viadribacter manganicus]
MIIFVHGVPDTPALWRPLISALGLSADAWRAPALPGFGNPVRAGFNCTKDAYVAWLIGELEQIGAPVDLVGHDWGALIALRAASLRPDLISSWCVTNAVIDPDYRGHRTARAWATPLLGELTMLAMRNTARLEQGLIAGGMPASLAKEETPKIDMTMRRSILKLYRSAKGLRFEGAWIADLERLPKRGQVFWGEADPYVDLSVAERFTRQHGFPLHVEKGAGHWACHERAAQFAELLKSHWSRTA